MGLMITSSLKQSRYCLFLVKAPLPTQQAQRAFASNGPWGDRISERYADNIRRTKEEFQAKRNQAESALTTIIEKVSTVWSKPVKTDVNAQVTSLSSLIATLAKTAEMNAVTQAQM